MQGPTYVVLDGRRWIGVEDAARVVSILTDLRRLAGLEPPLRSEPLTRADLRDRADAALGDDVADVDRRRAFADRILETLADEIPALPPE